MSLARSGKTAAVAQVDDIAVAHRVLRLEAEALLQLAGGLDGTFARAVELCAGLRGRVVVTGMGKSGHVGGKTAATLASTGTPAFFVHPAEASHGDLGMVTAEDLVIALSNSGETQELSAIVAFTRRFNIPLIGITSRPGSTLAEQADVALLLPPVPEACSLELAPTTSTTLMLALGDALAVALMERRGFSALDFKVFHPGGKLGQKLLRVADLMHGGDELPLADAGTPMTEAILTMTAKRFGCVGVVDTEGRLVGIVTDGDLRRHMGPELMAECAGRVMTASPKTIRPTALAAEALGVMNARSITTLFVTEGDKPVGIVHIHDLLRAGVA